MAHLSVRLPDDLDSYLSMQAEEQHQSKGDLVREALVLYQHQQNAKAAAEKLIRASKLVRENSMAVNKEFAAFEEDTHEA